MALDLVVIAVYVAAMLGVGFYARTRAVSQADFLVAGRRLGPVLYAGTMAAVVLGGASTVGGVALGYQHGISGMWLVFAIGVGILALSLLFAGRINRLKVFSVGGMLELRYGPGATLVSGLVMWAYTLMLATTSTIAYGTVLGVLFDIDKVPAILIGGSVVVVYSALGGMWSITLTDFVQFAVKTVGIFFVLLPVVLVKAGGWDGLHDALPASAFSGTAIGGDTIVTYFVVYGFGLLIGQDIWQRVFTARSDGVARWAGTAAGVYCLAYAVAGALIGMGARALLPNLSNPDDAFPQIVETALPAGVAGLVVAAALAAIMSTSSGALIATATVAKEDIVGSVRGTRSTDDGAGDEIAGSRLYLIGFGLVVMALACVISDVVGALTIAYAILVGGLLVVILGGMVWRRGTIRGALAGMVVGTVATLVTMAVKGDIYANEPIYVGLLTSLVAYVGVSVLTRPTPPEVLAEFDARVRG